ncbi:hypothetical protein DAPPUDRAFT_121123 [Daphnia pulex]|uniref:Uncharacterized protein n=1 Tax=Daphnia pulex TaxID=6669 RepID=E9I2R8_DAPPU|nr:hypothetical protein DAPPUDRAFT_121123 [Daphnia pulex]|eukprot:EFX61712.1 hypothetical protein DAPPUDRAFT_121123 [Daphnia pulex]
MLEGVGRSATTPVEVESNAEKAWAGLLQRQSKSNQMLKGVDRSATTPVEVESYAEKAWAGLLQRQSKSNQMLQGVGRSATTPVEVESNAARRGQVCYNASRSRIKCCKAWAGLLQRQSKSNQMLNSVIQNDAGSSGSKDQMITRSGQVEVDCI